MGQRLGRALGRQVETGRQAGDLKGDAILDLGRQRQQGERPEDGDGGGLVASDDHRGDLIAELGGRKAGPGFRVACALQQVEEVARGVVAGCGGFAPLIHDVLDQPHPFDLEPKAGQIV